MLDRGHSVTLLTATAGLDQRLTQRKNLDVISEPLLHPGLEDGELSSGGAARLELAVAAGKFDVVHSHSLTYPWVTRRSLFLLKLFAKYSLPVYDQAHGGDPERDPSWCIRLMQHVAALVVDSNYVAVRLTRMFWTHQARHEQQQQGPKATLPDMRLIYPRITEPDVFYPSHELRRDQRAELGIADEFLVFFPSRCFDVHGELSSRKRPLEAIRSFSAFLKKFPRARLLATLPPGFLPGTLEVESRKRINKLAQQLGIDHAILFIEEAAPASLMNRLYNAADVTLVPSVEGFGLVYVESMATGTPVVALKEGASGEVLGNDAAIFVEDSNTLHDEIASALLLLAGSPELARSIGAAARRRYETLLQPLGWAEQLEKLLRGAYQGERVLS
jgi:glycosyltransferase involved in cell wall biosynthesis